MGLGFREPKNPEQLRNDLDTMIEQERSAGRRANPEREAKALLDKLAEVDRKRNAYQDQQAEGLISLEELRAKLAALEGTRETVRRELGILQDHEEPDSKQTATFCWNTTRRWHPKHSILSRLKSAGDSTGWSAST